MSYTPGYRFDVFVSYAHHDNEPGVDGLQWVTQLKQYLAGALKQELGRGSGDLAFFFDSGVRANQQLPELLEAARHSAILLIVGSPAWLASDWCQRELKAFQDAARDPSRIFMAERRPLRAGDRYPDEVAEHIHLDMHFCEEGGPCIPLSPKFQDSRFSNAVHRLAAPIGDRLVALRSAAAGKEADDPRKTAPARPIDGCTVLIAQPTDDLAAATDQLDGYLRQCGIATVRASDLPQGGIEFVNGFERHLGECQLFVQLLGPYPGRKPADLPLGYTLFQAQRAEAAELAMMQWRRPGAEADADAEDASHRALLDGRTVTVSSLEEFKEAVKSKVLDMTRPAPPGPRAMKKPCDVVFIDADPSDLDGALKVKQEFVNAHFGVDIPMPRKSAEAARLELTSGFIESDVIIFLYGSSQPTWIKGQMRLFTKLQHQREKEPKLVAIYAGPPPETKEEIGFAIPDAREIACRDDWDMEPIRALILELQQ